MKHLLLIAALAAAPASALAQTAESSSAAKVPLARRLYDEGVDAAGKGRWSIAHDRFKASYELVPRVLTLFSLAYTQSQTGRLVEAGESYRRFLRDTSDGRYPDLRTEATSQLDQLDKQIAQVTLDIPRIGPDDVVVIDEVEFPHAALHEAIPMNPGLHVARVQRGPSVIATRKIALASGTAEAVQIDLPVPPPDLTVHRAPEPAPEPVTATAAPPRRIEPAPAPARGWLRSPWLWSGVAVVAAASVTGAYLLTRSPDGVTVH
jgi:hypothetical protein